MSSQKPNYTVLHVRAVEDIEADVGEDVNDSVAVGVGVADSVGVGVGVAVSSMMPVSVPESVGVGVGVGDSVGFGLGVAESVGVGVGDSVEVGVGVADSVEDRVGDSVGVGVGDSVGVGVGVNDSVGDGVGVVDCVGMGVGVVVCAGAGVVEGTGVVFPAATSGHSQVECTTRSRSERSMQQHVVVHVQDDTRAYIKTNSSLFRKKLAQLTCQTLHIVVYVASIGTHDNADCFTLACAHLLHKEDMWNEVRSSVCIMSMRLA